MKIFNTLGHKIEEFKPITANKVGIYSCGPTVYWNQHIGNIYAYVHWDVLVRLLRSLGYEVTWVMNITDVGHMTSDEDIGEDKMEKGARREGLDPWKIADKYIKQFTDSLQLMNVVKPDVMPRATEHIKEQIELIKRMEENGFTYKTQTGVVFDTAKFPDYAKFANLKLSDQEAGARVEVDPEKKNPWDFLLWVTNQPNHIMQWDSPWGKGFPGWHIECTAMSTKYLGEQFDIHTGGIEHIGVHHTNEIAQAYGFCKCITAKYWLHNAWLLIDGQKVSKSSGNTILVTDIVEKGIDPLSLRYLFLNSHYRQGLNFTWESLESANIAYSNLKSIMANLAKSREERNTLSPEKLEKVQNFKKAFDEALADDLALPKALAVVWQTVKSNIPSQDKRDLLLDFDQVLGLQLAEAQFEKKEEISPEILELLKKREGFRKAKEWEEADRIRAEIENNGYIIEDTDKGSKIVKKPI